MVSVNGGKIATCAFERTKQAVPESLEVKFLAPLAVAVFAAVLLGGAAGDCPVVIGAIYNLTGGQQNLDIPSSQGAVLPSILPMSAAGFSVAK